MNCTLQEIETHWSFADFADAHILLDAYEEAEARYAAKMRSQQRSR